MNLLKSLGVVVSLLCSIPGFSQVAKSCTESCCSGGNNSSKSSCSNAKAEITSKELSCKLTSPELRQRKEVVLASLKKKVVARQELDKGYRYKFQGSDDILDELMAFIKSERQCCSFFEFGLVVLGDGNMAMLDITGPEGAKKLIDTELEL